MQPIRRTGGPRGNNLSPAPTPNASNDLNPVPTSISPPPARRPPPLPARPGQLPPVTSAGRDPHNNGAPPGQRSPATHVFSRNQILEATTLPSQPHILDVEGNSINNLAPGQLAAVERFQQQIAATTTGATQFLPVPFTSFVHIPQDQDGWFGDAILEEMASFFAGVPFDDSALSDLVSAPAPANFSTYLTEAVNYHSPSHHLASPDLAEMEAINDYIATTCILAEWQSATLNQNPRAPHEWAKIATEPHAQIFGKVLTSLRGTAEYLHEDTHASMKAKVRELMGEIFHSPQFRKTCFEIVLDSTFTCGDQVTLAFNDLSIALINHRAEKGDYTENDLKTMARGLFRLDVLNRIAEEKMMEQQAIYVADPQRNHVDPIEVKLAYQTMLAEKLALPGVAHKMKHAYAARISENDLMNAINRIKDLESKGADVKFLANWEPWQIAMARIYPEAFAQFQQRIEQDEDWLRIPLDVMNTPQYETACNDKDAHKVAEKTQFMSRLTWHHFERQRQGSMTAAQASVGTAAT